MLPRKGCSKVELKGIFIGAKVVRGPDWDWGNQDGGDGMHGFFQLLLMIWSFLYLIVLHY